MRDKSIALKSIVRGLAVCILLGSSVLSVSAQSSDINAPSPVRRNELVGRIAARDLGDSRFTNHYYAFTGMPGDVLITVQGRNLNGDIDVFTVGTLRPLLKLSLYAESSAPVTKGIYLRRREDLILRIEARSPDDNEGTYQIIFSGSFEPIVGGPDIAENETPATDSSTASTARKGKRVSSVGARIDEPAPPVTEVAAAPTPEATPIASPSPPTSAKKAPVKTTPAESARSRRPAGRRTTTPAPKPKPATETEAQSTEEATTPATETEVATAPKPKPTGRTNTPRSGTTARPAKTPPTPPAETEPEPDVGPRLIIEANDGTLINRSMKSVRRLTVENGWVVVVAAKTGKIDRILLVNVVRMTIQP